jgi:hypothetical protein
MRRNEVTFFKLMLYTISKLLFEKKMTLYAPKLLFKKWSLYALSKLLLEQN